MNAEKLVHSNSAFIKLFLKILSLPYSGIVAARNYLYDKTILKSYSFPCFCIGVGNIVAGGAGKTPFVIWLAEKLKADRITAGVITNGYGGKRKGEYLVSDGKTIFVKPPEAQDEAYLIATHKIPVASGSRRLKAAMLLKDVDCIILDDSFQYRKAKKDIEILILGKKPFDNGNLIPAGLLREQISGIKRADLILSQSALTIKSLVPVFRYNLRPSHLINSSGKSISIEELKKPVAALCAIANPKNFFNDLALLGIEPEKKFVFPDHHIYSKKETENFKRFSSIITTEKDATKLSNLNNLFVLKRTVETEPDIYKFIKEKLVRALS